jgi:hypothetical protein
MFGVDKVSERGKDSLNKEGRVTRCLPGRERLGVDQGELDGVVGQGDTILCKVDGLGGGVVKELIVDLERLRKLRLPDLKG